MSGIKISLQWKEDKMKKVETKLLLTTYSYHKRGLIYWLNTSSKSVFDYHKCQFKREHHLLKRGVNFVNKNKIYTTIIIITVTYVKVEGIGGDCWGNRRLFVEIDDDFRGSIAYT